MSALQQRVDTIMSAGQEFAVSAVAAGLSHLIHHPLYTLKSQMMYYGPEFRLKAFFSSAIGQKSFLYRGEGCCWEGGNWEDLSCLIRSIFL